MGEQGNTKGPADGQGRDDPSAPDAEGGQGGVPPDAQTTPFESRDEADWSKRWMHSLLRQACRQKFDIPDAVRRIAPAVLLRLAAGQPAKDGDHTPSHRTQLSAIRALLDLHRLEISQAELALRAYQSDLGMDGGGVRAVRTPVKGPGPPRPPVDDEGGSKHQLDEESGSQGGSGGGS